MDTEVKESRRYICRKTEKILGYNRKEVKKKLGIGASRFATMFKIGLIIIEKN